MTSGIGGAGKDGNDSDLKLSPGCLLGRTAEAWQREAPSWEGHEGVETISTYYTCEM